MKSTSLGLRSALLFLLIIIFSSCKNEAVISFEKEKALSDSFLSNYNIDNDIALTDSTNLVLDSLIFKLSNLRPSSNQYWLQVMLVKANDLANNAAYKHSNDLAFQALALLKKEPKGNLSLPILADFHSLLGFNLDKLALYERSINHSEKARLIYLKLGKHKDVAGEYGNQALSNIAFGNIEEANTCITNGKKILDKLEIDEEIQKLQAHNQYVRALIYHQLAQYSSTKGQPKKMAFNCNQALQLFYSTVQKLKGNPNFLPHLQITYSSMATNYTLLGKNNMAYADSALMYLNKIIPYYQNNPTKVRSEYLGYLQGLASLNLTSKRDFKNASIYLEKALRDIGYYSYQSEFPKDILFKQHSHRIILASILSFKGTNYFKRYRKSKAIKDLLKSKSAFEESITIIEGFALDFSSEKSLIQYRSRLEEVFSNYVIVLLELYIETGDTKYFEASLTTSERHKSFILRQGLNRQISSYQIGDQRQSIIEKEKKFEKQRRTITQQLVAQPKNKLSILDSLLALQNRETTFIEELKNSDDPIKSNYYLNRYDQSIPDLSTIRKDFLDDKTALIEYNFSTEQSVAFVITSTQQFYVPIKIDDQFHTELEELLNENLYYENLPRFKMNAHNIYQRIFKDIHEQLPDEIDQLIIVPDNNLRALPFDALLSEMPSDETPITDFPFLLKEYAIGYIYSIATYHLAEKRSKANTQKTTFDFMGFNASPEKSTNDAYFEGCNPSALPNLTRATASISELFPSDRQRTFAKATKQDFINHASQTDILQLSMHGCIGQRAPLDYGLQFIGNADPLLTVNELLDLYLNARLVVLCSCDTESGQLSKGEGMASIARAFRQAGCLNMIASLQTVNDKFGAEIYKSFYHHWIVQGENSSVALAKAKREFLKNNAFTNRDKNPIKWAGIITIGKSINWKE